MADDHGYARISAKSGTLRVTEGIMDLLRPVEMIGPDGPNHDGLPRFTLIVQQEGARAHKVEIEWGAARGYVFGIRQMWAILGILRKIAYKQEPYLTKWAWSYVELNPGVPPPRFWNDLILFP